jgi:hypothetical protein
MFASEFVLLLNMGTERYNFDLLVTFPTPTLIFAIFEFEYCLLCKIKLNSNT